MPIKNNRTPPPPQFLTPPGPVIEVTEEDWISDMDSDDEQDPKYYDNNKDVTQETKVSAALYYTVLCV